jgi:putative transposase
MKYDPDIHHRRSIRLKNYDYSQQGMYFITLCTKNRDCIFGEINDEEIILNEYGIIVKKCWIEITDHYPFIEIDKFIIMPNHIHGIIIINNIREIRVQNIDPQQERINESKINKYQHIIPGSIGSIIRGYKIGVTKWFRQNTNIYEVWQRNYYENIIRNEDELTKIRDYIINNPLKWKEDEEYKE